MGGLMRFPGLPVLVALALGPGVVLSTPRPERIASEPVPGADQPGRQGSAAAGAIELARLGEFLDWAHPAGDGCGSPADLAMVETWEGGVRASYRIVGGPSIRALEGVRARLIGEAHVELLVQSSPEGAPQRARPLRGPDPDLGMRRAAIDAVLRWRFEPALLRGSPLTYYRPVELTFGGLPPESRDW